MINLQKGFEEMHFGNCREKSILNQPYIWRKLHRILRRIGYHVRFWMLSLVFFALGIYFYFFSSDSVLDINIHDTYYVIAYTYVFQWFGLWFALCGLGYWLVSNFKVKMIRWMHWMHLGLSILPFVLMPIIGHYQVEPNIYYLGNYMFILILWFMIPSSFILGQLLYFLNILISTIKNVKNKSLQWLKDCS